MWEARAEYEDGTSIECYFEENKSVSEAEDQYRIESWLIERHPGCIWYSANWINE